VRYAPVSNNILNSSAEALCNAVNTMSVMGAGLALAFKREYPKMFEEYTRVCRAGGLKPGGIHVYDRRSEGYSGRAARYIINIATKEHWRNPSQMAWIRQGLQALKEAMGERAIGDVAIPMLGAGRGGLNPQLVHAEMTLALRDAAFDFEIYDLVDERHLHPVVPRRGDPPVDGEIRLLRRPGANGDRYVLVPRAFWDELPRDVRRNAFANIRYVHDITVRRAIDPEFGRAVRTIDVIRSPEKLREFAHRHVVPALATELVVNAHDSRTIELPASGKPRVLVLDDLRTFTDDHYDFTHVRTNAEAIAQLEAGGFAAVWLDFDLDATDRRFPTSMPTAQWLKAHPDQQRTVAIITARPLAAATLQHLLPEATLSHRGLLWDKEHHDIDFDFPTFVEAVRNIRVEPTRTTSPPSHEVTAMSVQRSHKDLIVEALEVLADDLKDSYFYGPIQELTHHNDGRDAGTNSNNPMFARLRRAFPEIANATDLGEIDRYKLSEIVEDVARAIEQGKIHVVDRTASQHITTPTSPSEADRKAQLMATLQGVCDGIRKDGLQPRFAELTHIHGRLAEVCAIVPEHDVAVLLLDDRQTYTLLDMRNDQHAVVYPDTLERQSKEMRMNLCDLVQIERGGVVEWMRGGDNRRSHAPYVTRQAAGMER
jgi:O-acetyl-ADP-ribose deacetylase (regulator of RNase III)